MNAVAALDAVTVAVAVVGAIVIPFAITVVLLARSELEP